ncbi:hypothetical protein GCM10011611_34910 [Aliidongia dinghuensis]|uniref:Uncharacterized protein n=1 Tax=Aliidongia dinghuensis TaxID=1867774 RepID=A0A8J3E4C2_9PROT|nr:hypothetical protein [Aliidongia dinghuensis]GGF25881.1 hypothetical protein GCM10011611_34910 [Aliidongia dinghuensis]
MLDHSRPVCDRHLDTTTAMSCQREPVCFAFLCANAAAAPQPIDRLNFDIASADFHRGRASVWATLEMRGEARADGGSGETLTLLGFDEGFLRPFTRAVLEAASTRVPHRMSIRPDPDYPDAPRVVDYIRGTGGTPITELVVIPYDQVLAVVVPVDSAEIEETLFQLPRTDSFLRAFARMAHLADAALRDTIGEMSRNGRAADAAEAAPVRRAQPRKATSARPKAP